MRGAVCLVIVSIIYSQVRFKVLFCNMKFMLLFRLSQQIAQKHKLCSTYRSMATLKTGMVQELYSARKAYRNS